MKRLFIFLPALILFFAFTARALAVTASPSASASDSAKSMIKEQVEKAIKEQSEEPGSATTLKQPKFGIIGTLEKIVGSSLQVRDIKGKLRLIELDHGAVIITGQRQIAKEDLELNVPVIVMGWRQADDTLLARRIIISDDTIFGTKRGTIYGKIQSVTTKLITLISSLTVKLSANTSYLNVLGSTVKRSDLKPSDQILAVFSDTDTSSGSAKRVYTLSPAAIPSPTVLPISN